MRNRIEHAELITEEQIKRAQELGLILSMQPNFAGQWGYPGGMYETRLGERYRNNNPFRQILDAGVVVAFGSDCMPLGPLYGIHCAVNHPNPECRMTPEEALRCYTISGAYASFEENVKGSIEVGKLADLVVLSESPLEASPDTIKDIRVEITMVGGEVVI
jgi:predicted amidohydrolase YtcJ